MGLCIYTPGQKNAYVPVNHVHYKIDDNNQIIELGKLQNQLTEQQIHNQLQRVINSKINCIYTNAPFDIEVLYSTCDAMLPVYWDTAAASKVLDENELAALKAQYKLTIDPNAEKYALQHSFAG